MARFVTKLLHRENNEAGPCFSLAGPVGVTEAPLVCKTVVPQLSIDPFGLDRPLGCPSVGGPAGRSAGWRIALPHAARIGALMALQQALRWALQRALQAARRRGRGKERCHR